MAEPPAILGLPLASIRILRKKPIRPYRYLYKTLRGEPIFRQTLLTSSKRATSNHPSDMDFCNHLSLQPASLMFQEEPKAKSQEKEARFMVLEVEEEET